jgi:hypothetical protein
MRTTITLAPDVEAAVQELRRRRGGGVSEVVNELVRRQRAARAASAPFRQRSSAMGLPQRSLDDVAGLLDTLEGDDRRS